MTRITPNRLLWSLWLALALATCAWLASALTTDGDRTLFMPGPLSDGHYQLTRACEACHTDPLGGGEVLQAACVQCHGEDRQKPMDSHPRTKFSDPRNADTLAHLNALACVTCHTEHRPAITAKNGLTQPRDLCAHCHRKIAEDRPSHAGMAFDSCTDAGCHNFHDNRALYTDFLVKHLDDPDLAERPRLPRRELAARLDELIDYPHDAYPVRPLTRDDLDAPAAAADDGAVTDWLETAHARAGVNCSACHSVGAGDRAAWTDHPGTANCGRCHGVEVRRFGQGKHGMRPAAGLPAMTPAQARLPMKADAADRALTCLSCHGAHRFDTREAAVGPCLACHDDDHSRAYRASPHYILWQRELAGELPPGSGVSCASCHMPRIDYDVSDWVSRVMVDHNQSHNLSPNSKMIRSSCLHCHGLAFSLDALADPALIRANFRGASRVHVASMALARQDQARAERERAEAATE